MSEKIWESPSGEWFLERLEQRSGETTVVLHGPGGSELSLGPMAAYNLADSLGGAFMREDPPVDRDPSLKRSHRKPRGGPPYLR